MHKPKKPAAVPSPSHPSAPSAPAADNYRSQGSKGRAVGAINMKDFKCEIDHEIAKCLDTLDRQGLKFLRETLRASQIFGLNTQELGLTQPLEEQVESDDSPRKITEEPVRKQQAKVSAQGKRAKDPKKESKQEGKKQPKGKQAGGLNQKINKRLEGLNIKTGKKADTKPPSKLISEKEKIKVEPHDEIAQQIEVDDYQSAPPIRQEQAVKQESIITTPKQQSIPIKQDALPVSLPFREGTAQQVAPLKPFCKKPLKKHHQQAKHRQQLDYGVEITRPEKLCTTVDQQPTKIETPQEPIETHTQNENEEDRQIPKEETPMKEEGAVSFSREEESAVSITKNEDSAISPVSAPKEQETMHPKRGPVDAAGFESLINAIGRLSPSKRMKLQRIIERMENSQNLSDTSSLLSTPARHDQLRPYIAAQRPNKHSEVRQHSKSRSKIQKVEKATSLKGSLLVARIPHTPTTGRRDALTPTNAGKVEAGTPHQNVFDMEEARSQLVTERRQHNKEAPVPTKGIKASFSKGQEAYNNKPILVKGPQGSSELSLPNNSKDITQNKKEMAQTNKEGLSQSRQLSLSTNNNKEMSLSTKYRQQLPLSNNSKELIQSNASQKLIKVGKRKPQNTTITLKIISNRGHPSLVGLTSIHIYNTQGIPITINQTHIRNPSPKLLRLFTDPHRPEGWLTALSGATILIQNIGDTLGGMRVVNWNRSELEADRQADLAEVRVNQQLHWRGQLKGGSYCEGEAYATNIQLTSRPFEFPSLPQQSTATPQRQDWLEKEAVEQQLRQLQEEQRREKVKKISSIRSTVAMKNDSDGKVEDNWLDSPLKRDKKQRTPIIEQVEQKQKQPVRLQKQPNSNGQILHHDILGELSRQAQTKTTKQDSLSAGKRKEQPQREKPQAKPVTRQTSRQEPIKKEEASRKEKEEALRKEKEEAFRKEKEQDDQFEKILQSMEQRARPQEQTEVVPQRVQPSRGKLAADKKIQDFMKDSLFDEQPWKNRSIQKPLPNRETAKDGGKQQGRRGVSHQLDALIGELNDVVAGDQQGEQFTIPDLPIGRELVVVLVSNWGSAGWMGLNGLQLFDSSGEQVRPVGVSCAGMQGKQLYQRLFKQELLTTDQNTQAKFPKAKKVHITLTLPTRIELAAVRIWNYNGHRVHNNVGVRKMQLKLDGKFIFSGQVRQSSGSSQDAHKFCQHILFTESQGVLKRISDNDWLGRLTRQQKEERDMFSSTLQNFHRPPTRNDDHSPRPQQPPPPVQAIKPSKRQAEYDPPLVPQGFILRLLLHSSWGDRFFIGLNGIELFNEKGENITTKNLLQIRADPSSICQLQGCQQDKRVVTNLINGRNRSPGERDIWLAPLLSDVERIEKGPNLLLLEYSKPVRLSAINIYNYSKTPSRGAREVELFMDQSLLYRGYLRTHDASLPFTTIPFTKQTPLLQSIGYAPYSQEQLQQQVALVNEEKVLKAVSTPIESALVRPMTGHLLW